MPETSAIFISDSSAEADRLSDVLRARGYAVVDVPLSLLLARVVVQRPALVLLDIDAEEASAVVERLRALPGADDIELLFLGERDAIFSQHAEAFRAHGGHVFARPIDARALVAKIEQLIGPASLRDRSSAGPSSPSDSLSAHHHEAFREPSPLPSSGPGPLPSLGSTRFSPELSSLLRRAEERVEAEPASLASPPPSPEQEVEAVLPAEVLAALDEPLSEADDFSQSGEEEGSGRGITTGEEAFEPSPPFVGHSRTDPHRAASQARPTVAPRRPKAHEVLTPKPPGLSAIPPFALPKTIAPRHRPAAPPPPPEARSHRPPPPPEPPRPASIAPSPLTRALGEGEALGVVAAAIADRKTGSLCFESPEGIRRMLLRDGDLVTAASGIEDESLLAFLVSRGDLPKATGTKLRGKLPAFGRRAGAALIAYGHLEQDQLWPVLRAHAEWLIACALVAQKHTYTFETQAPARLEAEPSVFGGATGAEVLLEVSRRVIPAEHAIVKLGGPEARIADGPRTDLLAECALPDDEASAIARGKGATIFELTTHAPNPELPTTLYVLTLLGALISLPAPAGAKSAAASPLPDPLDAEALRTRVRARLELVQEADYFALLGVPRNATAYEVRRAYLELRRAFEPNRVLTAQTADLADDMRLIVEVLDEAYEILRDGTRRERYRRAIEAGPP